MEPSTDARPGSLDFKLLAFAAAFTMLYAALIGYFSFVDVYDRHFFENGYSPTYNIARTLFAVYFFWIVYYSGYFILRRIRRSPSALAMTLPERFAAGFFVGFAAWTLVMLLLGYAYLYYRLVAFTLTVPIVALSSHHVSTTYFELRNAAARFFRINSMTTVVLATFMAVGILVVATLLLLIKGLYPAGGHDYYTHYFYFYTTAIENHNIWPNEVWYQYFYSKAMGLFFLSMLLTDPMAPSSVTFCCAVATAYALFSLVQRGRSGTLWPWVAVILFFALYIHTVGTDIYRANGGWGDFQKPHEINSAFLMAILWMSTRISGTSGAERRVWWWSCALCAFTIPFILAISSGLVGLFLVLATVSFFVAGRRDDARAFFGLSVAAGTGLSTVLALNYVTTGVPLDQGLNWFWPIVDLYRVSEWGTIFDMSLHASVARDQWMNKTALFSHQMREFAQNVAKYDTLSLLFWLTGLTSVILLAVLAFARRRTFTLSIGQLGSVSARGHGFEGSAVRAFWLVLLFLLASAIYTIVFGTANAISYARIASFALPLLIAASALIWQMANTAIVGTGALRWLFQYLIPVAVAYGTLDQAYLSDRANIASQVRAALRFARGKYSIYDGYKDQSGWPARLPWGAVHPGMLAAWKEVGPGTRIWSSDVWSYCMLPACRVEGFYSFRVSPHEPEVFIGSPEKARKILQSEGLNYFFISWDLEDWDLLPCAPLLSVEHIAENLGVKWTDGTSYLLTWLGPGVSPLTAEWVARYRAHIKAGVSWARCDENPPYLLFGRKVYEQVMQGKRWGAEIPMSSF
jgi:hypothetical protein